MTRVALLVPGPPGDGSWVDAAVHAVQALGGAIDVEVLVGTPEALPAADVVLAHGIQYEALARTAEPGTRVLMTDRPVDLAGLENATVIDWSWFEAAYVAGAVAAGLTRGPVGLIAGPAVRTQRRLASAFTQGVERKGRNAGTTVVHLPSFGAIDRGREAGRLLVEQLGCEVLLTSADSAGDAAAVEGRRLGARTLGFLHPHPDDVGHVRSDVTGVLSDLLRRAVAGESLPPLVSAGLASGSLSLDLANGASPALVAVRDEATEDVVALAGLLD